MQFTVTINQAKALEWGLNSQQALLFAFVYECPSWARLVQTPAGDFYALSKAKILEELPLLTDKPDTAYRLLKQIAAAGVIDLSSTATITLVRLTAKGQEWNRKLDGSEKYPTQVGE
ncbi:phage replication protein, partial [Pseudomonas aeruginosa]|nr:phage replication protein [Pseudomonas aeruginosa]